MRVLRSRRLRLLAAAGVVTGVLAASAPAQSTQQQIPFDGGFKVTSAEFANNSVMPISTIFNNVVNGKNTCSVNGAPGGDQSPELSWTGVPSGTRSFVVTTYDVTASFTHWGMYNISGNMAGLPRNAGVAGSSYGSQVVNDFQSGAEYDGPCPPTNVAPDVHRYQFKVYALDDELELPGSTNFPANAETLYQALLGAEREHHILASATVTGLYSSTASSH